MQVEIDGVIPPSLRLAADERRHHAAILTKQHPDALAAVLVRLSRRHGLLEIAAGSTQPQPILPPTVQGVLQAQSLVFCQRVAGQPAQDNIQLFRPVFNACFHKRSVFQIHHLPRNANKSAHGVDGSYFMCALLRLWSLLFPVPQPGKKGFCPPLKLSYPVKFWGISVGACMVWPDCTGAAGAAWEAPGAWE